ncbi:MAG: DUF1993 domain-containing protein [Novosphingobium sp.]|nr:DUF1993 domain-containing protein [Novosphingobium sp.]
MSVSLHTATVGTFLQILPSVSGLIDKAEEHCRTNGLDAEALTGTRLAEDQWNFAKQVFECGHHSSRAIEGVRAGMFEPELHEVPLDFASLRKEVADATALLQAVEPAEIDAMVGRDMKFAFGGKVRMEFTVEDFLLTFSLPNFYFHATTAYDILRNQGLPIGKMDYLGRPRVKP